MGIMASVVMLKKLIIKNFRTHKETILSLCSGFNVLYGLPESGKTNIIRAIRWALTNRPLGFRFHSNFSEALTSVTLLFDNGKIRLTKSVREANYVLVKGGKLTKFHALGSSVPDEITNVANMSELNIQEQFEAPFLVSASPGEVAKEMNRVTGLSKIDKAISSFTTDINDTNKEVRSLNARIASLEQQLEEIGDVDTMEIMLKEIEEWQEALEDEEQTYEEVEYLLTELNALEAKISYYLGMAKEAEKLVLEIDKLYKEQAREEKAFLALQKVIDAYSAECESVDRYYASMQSTAKEYRNYLNTIKQCPFCNVCTTPIKEHNLDDVLKEYDL